MKHLTHITCIFMLFLFSVQTFAQKEEVLFNSNYSSLTDIVDNKTVPEGIEMVTAFIDGSDIVIEFVTENTEGTFNLNIYDVLGKLVVSQDFFTNNTHNKIRLASSISSRGIYIVSLCSQSDKAVKKFYL